MATIVWPPGPLLKPLEESGRDLFNELCTCNWFEDGKLLVPPEDNLKKQIGRVSVTSLAIVFLDKQTKQPVISKRLTFLPESATVFHGTKLVSLYKRPNIHDDFSIDITFRSKQAARDFCTTIEQNRKPATLGTKIYTLASTSPETEPDGCIPTANILKGFPAIEQAITGVLTGLAYSESADILGPLVRWDARKIGITPQERTHRIATIQNHYQASPPPLILVLGGGASFSDSPLPEAIIWDDSNPTEFLSNRFLPLPPTWPGPGGPPNSWVTFPILNYGIHARDDDKSRPKYIALSYDLVDHFAAADSASKQHYKTAEDLKAAKLSLDAATASLKSTLIHELAHLWVTETDGESPARARVTGVQDSAYDVAEDSQRPGFIESGLLVETVWLGRPQELACDQLGWLKLAVREDPEEQDFSWTPSANPSPGSDIPHIPQLGSPINLASSLRPPRSPPPPDIESPVAARICDPELVSLFTALNLPAFDGLLYDRNSRSPVLTPTRRNKNSAGGVKSITPIGTGSRWLQSTSTSPNSPLLLGRVSAVAPRTTPGVKWPKVSGEAPKS
ncbi:hypothetical protein DFH09DRAFT_1318884 [Mycena vulgaris]|nr:hypothetical protein DFH09DRAFT_1318884 [Mycena vulgaris]